MGLPIPHKDTEILSTGNFPLFGEDVFTFTLKICRICSRCECTNYRMSSNLTWHVCKSSVISSLISRERSCYNGHAFDWSMFLCYAGTTQTVNWFIPAHISGHAIGLYPIILCISAEHTYNINSHLVHLPK